MRDSWLLLNRRKRLRRIEPIMNACAARLDQLKANERRKRQWKERKPGIRDEREKNEIASEIL